ncbi:SEC61B [Auxenochlorella protothecoides x Auxenochlorella symbiontica]
MAAPSQASTLVNRGGRSGGEGASAPRSTPTATASRARRASTRGSAAKGGYFYTDDSSAIKLSPTAVIGAAVSFIIFVFILHIFGKLRG